MGQTLHIGLSLLNFRFRSLSGPVQGQVRPGVSSQNRKCREISIPEVDLQLFWSPPTGEFFQSPVCKGSMNA